MRVERETKYNLMFIDFSKSNGQKILKTVIKRSSLFITSFTREVINNEFAGIFLVIVVAIFVGASLMRLSLICIAQVELSKRSMSFGSNITLIRIDIPSLLSFSMNWLHSIESV